MLEAVVQERVELALQLRGLRTRAPAQIAAVRILGEQPGEVGAPAVTAGARGELVGEAFVVREARAARALGGALITFQ
jgi:hypothetical protein